MQNTEMTSDLFRSGSVVVTGAGAGIGRATCELLVREGVSVVGVDLDEGLLASLAESTGEKVAPCSGDVTDQEVLVRAADLAETRGPLVGWVNNAANFAASSFRDTPLSVMRETLEGNLFAAMTGTQISVQRFIAAGTPGSIVNLSSVQSNFPAPNYTAYGLSKTSLEGLTRATAADCGSHRIRANAVAPGGVRSERSQAWLDSLEPELGKRLGREFEQSHALGRRGRPDEIGEAIVFLLSPRASWITGATLVVDGGRSAWSWDEISAMK